MPLSVLVAASASLLWALPVNPGLADWQLLFLTCIFRTTFLTVDSPYDGSPVAFQDLKHALGMAVLGTHYQATYRPACP